MSWVSADAGEPALFGVPLISTAQLAGASSGGEGASSQSTLDSSSSSRSTNQAAAGDEVVSRVQRALSQAAGFEVAVRHDMPARPGSFGPWPSWVSPDLQQVFAGRGITVPYEHQSRALEAIGRGSSVVIATATASGKSLCFQSAMLQAAIDDPAARTLMLYPTKALARDQVEGLRNLISSSELRGRFGAGIYDGDASPDQRRAARQRAHFVATNPDMLHHALLPNHRQWANFLANLRYVVIDEVHTYRGVFGSHVANVLRRLWRICEHYGASPQVIACSATIANPGEHVARLSGHADIVEISGSTAPTGATSYLVVNPKVADPLTGVRRDFLKVTREVGSVVLKHQLRAIVFCRTRKAVELLTRYMREDEAQRLSLGDQGISASERVLSQASENVRGYRGGYLPELRREVESALRDGQAKVVAATNALELGMDIGGLDAVVIAGYPGSRAAMFQRAGRAGRRGQSALVVLVLSSLPTDQFLANSPEFLFSGTVEHARIDPNNPEILVPHLRCAGYELPLRPGEQLAGVAADDYAAATEYLCASNILASEVDVHGEVSYRYQGPHFPAQAVELRGSCEENFSVVDEVSQPSGKVLAEVDFEDGPLYLHVGAIYAIEGRTHEVKRLDWDARKAFVRTVDADYYTEAITKTRVRILDHTRVLHDAASKPCAGVGWMHYIRSVPAFKKIRLRSHETLGVGPINLPDLEMHTASAFWRVPQNELAAHSDPRRRASVVLAMSHVLHHVAALLCMCDPGDLSCAVAGGEVGAWADVVATTRGGGEAAQLQAMSDPVIYLYDQRVGGSGLAEIAYDLGSRFFARAQSLVASCSCRDGCPTCVGAEHAQAEPGSQLRAQVALMLDSMAKMLSQAQVQAVEGQVET